MSQDKRARRLVETSYNSMVALLFHAWGGFDVSGKLFTYNSIQHTRYSINHLATFTRHSFLICHVTTTNVINCSQIIVHNYWPRTGWTDDKLTRLGLGWTLLLTRTEPRPMCFPNGSQQLQYLVLHRPIRDTLNVYKPFRFTKIYSRLMSKHAA